jgi:hypothetical protein
MPYIALGKTVSFAAVATGLSSSAVTWSAGGKVGGTAIAGSISPTGLYTAPTLMPAQNPILVTATSAANSKYSFSTYVNLLTAGPKITSVAPNPISPGTITVTIKGATFAQYATTFVTYGTNSRVQMTTTSVSKDSITAVGYLGPCTKAAFCVRNPGSDFSNTITIPVATSTTGDSKTQLTVINGTGSGSYAAGTVVTITANTPPAGQTFVKWTGAPVANAASPTTTLTMPSAATTITATYSGGTAPPPPTSYPLTVISGSGTGSYVAGAVVPISANVPPLGQVFLKWTGAAVANANAPSTTITMPAAPTSITATFAAPAPVPFPVTTHPRIWVTPADLPRLQGWAAASNPIWAKGLQPLIANAYNIYKTQFFPNGVQNPNYPDPGDVQGYSGYLTEEYGSILAFDSLVDPSPSQRIASAQAARNMLMVAMNQAVKGHLANAPFRDPMFAVYNHANGSGEDWALIVDWIYNAKDAQGNAILTPTDKRTIRDVFLIWANDCVTASTTGGDHPVPVGVTNSLQLLPSNQAYRMASNNYYMGHSRLMTMMALSIDPADDPPVNANVAASTMGNSLRSYILAANGAWLYQEYAMMGDSQTVAADYGIPGSGKGLGMASGGLPPEGMLYGHSFAFILGQLLALQTAGFHNPAIAGPQVKLIDAPVWDRYVTGYISSMVPAAQTFASQSYLGPVYQYASYGDLLRLWVTPDVMQSFSLLSLLDAQNGKTSHNNAARWFAINAVEGGSANLYNRITNPFSYGSTAALLYFLLLDPTLPAPTDPRVSFPTTFYDAPAGRIVSHSDWTPNATMFDYRASWISINHQLGDGGQFELFRDGEWLTKEMSNYDNNAVGLTTTYHNTLSLQNWCSNGTPSLSWFESGEWANGSQWILGANAGDPTTVMSTGSGYVYASSDLTNLYNRPNFWSPLSAAADIVRATRSILWLDGDYVIVYDRATSTHNGLYKRFNLSLVTKPTISGNTATQTLPSGQQLFVQTLLPGAPTISAAFAPSNLNPIAQLEPTQYIMTVEDATKPTDTRFLHVLQGADAGTTKSTATYVRSSAGTSFDGAKFANVAVFFPSSATAAFMGTTLPTPSGVQTVIVTGLTPNATYTVGIATVSATSSIVVTPGAGAQADSAGVLTVAL